jgi:hypothetical protein
MLDIFVPTKQIHVAVIQDYVWVLPGLNLIWLPALQLCFVIFVVFFSYLRQTPE